jgi:hypothetical protein
MEKEYLKNLMKMKKVSVELSFDEIVSIQQFLIRVDWGKIFKMNKIIGKYAYGTVQQLYRVLENEKQCLDYRRIRKNIDLTELEAFSIALLVNQEQPQNINPVVRDLFVEIPLELSNLLISHNINKTISKISPN